MYLTFMKYSAIMFAFLFIFGGFPLIILYNHLSYDEKQEAIFDSQLERITIKTFLDSENFD